jgi:dGTPase
VPEQPTTAHRAPHYAGGVASRYGAESRARFVAEPPKRAGRTPFERDRGRIVHSSALRRLGAKTQVLGAGFDDFVRNRLTHSLEVAQIARGLGESLGCDPDVVDSAALAHDLGHPPFGHNGEDALAEAAAACGGFEGNAQTLRLLTRLEAKSFDATGRSVGLNLTRATLAACVKYPWMAGEGPEANGGKFGVYADDAEVWGWIRADHPAWARPIESDVMDLSDDIAYCVHDVEDGVVAGWFQLHAIEPEPVFDVARDWYEPTAGDDRLGAALERLSRMPEWLTEDVDGSTRSLASLKGLTSALIGRFAIAAQSATLERWGSGPHTRYSARLEVPTSTRDEITVLKAIAAHYVMRADSRVDDHSEEQSLIRALVEALTQRDGRDLLPQFAEAHLSADSDAARLRAVIDQVASLTDRSATTWAHRIAT